MRYLRHPGATELNRKISENTKMPIAELTEGAILRIFHGHEIKNPILQVLGVKRIQFQSSEAQECYRLLVSDGKNKHSLTTIAKELNHMFVNNLLTNYTVIRVTNYIWSRFESEGKIKLVLGLSKVEVLNEGSEVGKQIGDPVFVDMSNTDIENEKPETPVDKTPVDETEPPSKKVKTHDPADSPESNHFGSMYTTSKTTEANSNTSTEESPALRIVGPPHLVKPLLNTICDNIEYIGVETSFKLSQKKQDFELCLNIKEPILRRNHSSICLICWDEPSDFSLSCCKSKICTFCFIQWPKTCPFCRAPIENTSRKRKREI